MTSKEALEEIRDFRYGKDKLLVCQTKMYKIIEKDLEELERYRKIMTKPILKLISDQIKFEEIRKLAVNYLNSNVYPDEKFMNKVLRIIEDDK